MSIKELSYPNINNFYIGQPIPSLYPGNKGFTVTDINKEKRTLTLKQDGSETTHIVHLIQFIRC